MEEDILVLADVTPGTQVERGQWLPIVSSVCPLLPNPDSLVAHQLLSPTQALMPLGPPIGAMGQRRRVADAFRGKQKLNPSSSQKGHLLLVLSVACHYSVRGSHAVNCDLLWAWV